MKKRDHIEIRGFTRVGIGAPGSPRNKDGTPVLVGDSGFVQNTIVNEGVDDFLCRLLAATDSSKQVHYVALGTGTEPGATATTIAGEISDSDTSVTRKVLTVSISQSKTVRFTATFASSDNHISAAQTLQNIGLFQSNASDDFLFAGTKYTTSSVNTNQDVYVTYDIQFTV